MCLGYLIYYRWRCGYVGMACKLRSRRWREREQSTNYSYPQMDRFGSGGRHHGEGDTMLQLKPVDDPDAYKPSDISIINRYQRCSAPSVNSLNDYH